MSGGKIAYGVLQRNIRMTDETASFTLATFSQRALAFSLDVIVLTLSLGAIFYLLFGAIFFEAVTTPMRLAEILGLSFTQMRFADIGPAVVAVVMLVKFKGTPGKLLMKLEIVDVDTLQALSYSKALLRQIGYIPSTLALGLGFFWMLQDDKNQCWHDKLGHSLVISRRSKRSL